MALAKRNHDLVGRVRFEPALEVEPWPDFLFVDAPDLFRQDALEHGLGLLPGFVGV